ncbi:hypothetical protein QEN19_002559 [Hanseniaspora menglaensis]
MNGEDLKILFKFIYSKPYLKAKVNALTDDINDDASTDQSEAIDISKIQSFLEQFQKFETDEEIENILKYLLKITFDDFKKFSDSNLHTIIIIGILIKLNYFNDILIMELFQALLKCKQLGKIKILIHLLGNDIDKETLVNKDIKHSLLEILNRRKVQLPIYPESFEWDIIFQLSVSLDQRQTAFDITKEDIVQLETFSLDEGIYFDVTESQNKEEEEEEEDNGDVKIENLNTKEYHRLIYLIIKSSGTSDEIVHKILKMKISEDDEKLLILYTIIKNCSEEKLYSKLYENILMKICDSSLEWENNLEKAFDNFYNKDIEDEDMYPNLSNIKNVSNLFSSLLAKDTLDFKVFKTVKINSRDSTERKRVFLKFLFKQLVMNLSLENVKKIMLKNTKLRPYLIDTVFPSVENSKDMIYSINFFTAIDLGELTVHMRKQLNDNKKKIEENELKRRIESTSTYEDINEKRQKI